jgi:chaperonin GroES
VKPLGDRIIVRPVPRETETDFGLLLPEGKDPPVEGIVTAVGPGRWLDDGTREQVDVRVGDRVVYVKHAGYEHAPEALVITQRDVLAVVE